ncbi:MAG TPA: glycosyltransferase family 1 protein [Terriglobia bacterium]|nr:glycosyltransferase family 1 protein [Terriglobia bacterium]
MATIALDATYTLDHEPTGVTAYCRGLIAGLAALQRSHRFLLCYRVSRFGRRRHFLRPGNSHAAPCPTFSTRLFQEPFTFWLPWQAKLFHSLNQRPPAFHFEREVVTVFDVLTLTDQSYWAPDFRKKFSTLLIEAVARAARTITLSQHTADRLVELCGVPRDRIRVIPAGVDAPQLTLSVGERVRLRADRVGPGNEMVLSVGAIQVRKNTLNAVRAVSLLPPRYKLVLAGANGYGSEAVDDFIRQERLESRVVRLGYVPAERLPELYEAASVLLFPSFGEGFGFPVLEAMSHGLPVVISNVSSLPELGGDAALYVDPQDPDAMAQQVMRAVEATRLRETLVTRGLARARQFTWRRAAEETCNVYEELLAT